MSKLGRRLLRAATEAVAIVRGEADPSTYNVHLPSPDPMADGMRDAYLARLARERAIAEALSKALYGHSGDARSD